MPNLFFAKEELKFAEDALSSFLKDKSFSPTNKHFSDFLIHLELSFIKAERGCQDIKNIFTPFQGYYKRLRRKDPLLSYLKNARDAISHDNTTIVDLEIVSRKIVDYIEIEITSVEGEKRNEKHPMFPARIKLHSFKINGTTWEPPKKHLDIPLMGNNEPMEVGLLGLKFYKKFIKDIEEKLINTNK